jgi:hypothetical protein
MTRGGLPALRRARCAGVAGSTMLGVALDAV